MTTTDGAERPDGVVDDADLDGDVTVDDDSEDDEFDDDLDDDEDDDEDADDESDDDDEDDDDLDDEDDDDLDDDEDDDEPDDDDEDADDESDDDDEDDDDLDDEDDDEYEPGDVNAVDTAPYEAGDVNTIAAGRRAAETESAGAGRGEMPVAVLEYVARAMADEPDAVVIRKEERRGSTLLRLHVAPRDMGRVIGRRGRTAQAIRTLVGVAGARDGVQTVVDIADD